MLTQKQLGQKIKSIRKSKNLTQEKLAEIVGVDFGYISKLEVGQNFPSILTLNKIADALETDISVFFNYYNLQEINIKEEIIAELNDLSVEKQIYLYKFLNAIK